MLRAGRGWRGCGEDAGVLGRPSTADHSPPSPASDPITPPAELTPLADPTTRKEAVERPPAAASAAPARPALAALALADGGAIAPPPPDETRIERIGSVEGPGDPESAGPAPASPGSPRVPKDDHSPLMGGRVPRDPLPADPVKPDSDESR